jgi:Type VI secretion system VasI, EvfG, VC_A0118
MEEAAAPLDVSEAYSTVAPPVLVAPEPPPVPVTAEAPPIPVVAEAPPVLFSAEAAPVPVAAPIPVAAQAALPKAVRSNRRMLVAALLVVAGGTLTFAMLRSSAPAIPVATPGAKPKPAASKPGAPNAGASAAAAGVAAPAVPSKWRAANKEWLLNAKKGVAFELPSQNRVTIWQGITQPMLVVRCDAGRLQAFVYTASAIQMEAIDENHSVRVSFDDEPEVTERWADSSDHDALFAPDSAAFAGRLIGASKLTVGYKPHNAQRVVAEFQTAGLNDLIAPAAKQCGWKK